MYAVALAGSTLYALMTVASAYALGWVTQHTILPAFASGHTTAGALWTAAGLIIGVSVLKCIGIAGRRTGAGIMQYRLMGAYRRRITKQYLHLPLAWHQDWSTGTLLSNANSDVEAMWSNIAPFPLACGVIIMLVATSGLLVATDWVLACVGFVVFPLVGVLTYWYGRAVAPRAMRAQELRGLVSSVAHDSFDGALVVKTLGREAAETERFETSALALRDGLGPARPGARPVRPDDGGAAQPRRAGGAAGRLLPAAERRHQHRPAGPGRLPVHPAGAADPGDRLRLRRDAEVGRRGRAGVPRTPGAGLHGVRRRSARGQHRGRGRRGAALGRLRLQRRGPRAPRCHAGRRGRPYDRRRRAHRLRKVNTGRHSGPVGRPHRRHRAL